jgi:capsular polysaccharide biosynthesis protein
MRELVAVLYRFIYRGYCCVINLSISKHFILDRFGSYSGAHLQARILVHPSQRLRIPIPTFFNESNIPIYKTVIPQYIEQPKIEVLELSDVSVVGATHFILAGDAVISPDCFIDYADYCPASMFGVTLINHSRKSIRFFLPGKGIRLDACISLLGQNTSNYAHWLTEIFPKLAVIDRYAKYNELPLLVDSGMHRNIYESINVLAGNNRQVILVKKWQFVSLRKLVSVSQAGYEPYISHKPFSNAAPKIVNAFSAPSLLTLRSAVLKKTQPEVAKSHEKLFFSRSFHSNNLRGLENEMEIRDLLKDNGFTIIDPFQVTFREQAKACSAAKIIVAPIGASLANMIFAPTNCRILALTPYYESANFSFYSNLAAALNIQMYYLTGRHTNNYGHPMHRNYEVNIITLQETIDSVLRGGV